MTVSHTGAPASLNREELLCQWALEEGFDRAGIARLSPSEHGEQYRRWVDQGDHAGMHYLARRVDERLNPSSRLEGSVSALCVALHYPDRQGQENVLWQGVARYAVGDDYHDVMMRRLRRLGDRIESAFPGCRSRSYVDTGPILERELGQRAGLGSPGKNTMLLHRTGSYFLLGEVLLTLELEPSATLPDLCGKCTRCLDACPTGALPEPYRLDARKCISYWTIEHRGEFSEAIAGQLNGWSFGCDICQQVCPWNQATNPRLREPENADHLRLPEERGGLDLVGLVTLERERYTEMFRGSAMKRAKLQGLQRNALISVEERLGQLLAREGGGEQLSPDLLEEGVAASDAMFAALDNPDGAVRAAARLVLAKAASKIKKAPVGPGLHALREQMHTDLVKTWDEKIFLREN